MRETEVANLSLFQKFSARVSGEGQCANEQHKHNNAHTDQVRSYVVEIFIISGTLARRFQTHLDDAVDLCFNFKTHSFQVELFEPINLNLYCVLFEI